MYLNACCCVMGVASLSPMMLNSFPSMFSDRDSMRPPLLALSNSTHPCAGPVDAVALGIYQRCLHQEEHVGQSVGEME